MRNGNHYVAGFGTWTNAKLSASRAAWGHPSPCARRGKARARRWRGAERARRRAELSNLALHAVRPARVATAPAVPDEPVAQERPLLPRDKLHQVFLDLPGFFLLR